MDQAYPDENHNRLHPDCQLTIVVHHRHLRNALPMIPVCRGLCLSIDTVPCNGRAHRSDRLLPELRNRDFWRTLHQLARVHPLCHPGVHVLDPTDYVSDRGVELARLAFFIWITCCFIETYLHCHADISPEGYKYLSTARNPSPKTTSSFLNRITMWWLNALCILGIKKPLEVNDLNAMNEADTSNSLVPKWFKLWEKQSKMFEDNRNRRRADSHRNRPRSSSNDNTPLLQETTGED